MSRVPEEPPAFRGFVCTLAQTHHSIREALAVAAADAPFAGTAGHSPLVVHEGNVFSGLAEVSCLGAALDESRRGSIDRQNLLSAGSIFHLLS